MKIGNNKGFTLIELVIVITIIGIISISSIKTSNDNTNKIFNSFYENITERIQELKNKTLIGINWHYNNNGVERPNYIKISCNNTTKDITAGLCDNTNNSCIPINFPNFSYLKMDFTYSNVSNIYSINNCKIVDKYNMTINGSYYIKILTDFPYSTILYHNPNNDEIFNDDIEVKKVKIELFGGNKKAEYDLYSAF